MPENKTDNTTMLVLMIIFPFIIPFVLVIYLINLYNESTTIKKVITNDKGENIVVEFKKVNGKYIEKECTPVKDVGNVPKLKFILLRKNKHIVVVKDSLEEAWLTGPFWFLRYRKIWWGYCSAVALSGVICLSYIILIYQVVIGAIRVESIESSFFTSFIIVFSVFVVSLGFYVVIPILAMYPKNTFDIKKKCYEDLGYKVVAEFYKSIKTQDAIDMYLSKKGDDRND